jgi:hypothetical protein
VEHVGHRVGRLPQLAPESLGVGEVHVAGHGLSVYFVGAVAVGHSPRESSLEGSQTLIAPVAHSLRVLELVFFLQQKTLVAAGVAEDLAAGAAVVAAEEDREGAVAPGAGSHFYVWHLCNTV